MELFRKINRSLNNLSNVTTVPSSIFDNLINSLNIILLQFFLISKFSKRVNLIFLPKSSIFV